MMYIQVQQHRTSMCHHWIESQVTQLPLGIGWDGFADLDPAVAPRGVQGTC